MTKDWAVDALEKEIAKLTKLSNGSQNIVSRAGYEAQIKEAEAKLAQRKDKLNSSPWLGRGRSW